MNEQKYGNALPPGYQLDGYTVLSVLGQGSFGITYECRDRRLDRTVAVKEYLPGGLAVRAQDLGMAALSPDLKSELDEGLERFLKEARTLARFEHRSIVRVHHVFEANRTAYMVMSYEEGETLREVLGRRVTLTEVELRHLLAPILDGLELVHATGFIHRDIKPGNIFIRRDGTPVLLDFGSARVGGTSHALTVTNFVSPGFAPIEQYTSKSDKQGPWTDIYALGATLYRAVTGAAPLPAVDRSEALAHDQRDGYEDSITTAGGAYSPAFLAAIDHALAFEPARRPQSIAEWRRELGLEQPASAPVYAGVQEPAVDHTATTMPVAAPSTLTASSTGAPPRHHGKLIAAGAAVGLVVGVVAMLSLHHPAGTPPARDAPSPEPAGATSNTSPGVVGSSPEESTGTTVPDPAQPLPDAGLPAEAMGIDTLLRGAEADVAALRLTSPAGASALDKYRQVLAMDPENADARAGIEKVADKYLELFYRDLAADDLNEAQTYLERAESITPGAAGVQQARSALAARRAATTAGMADAKRSPLERLRDVLPGSEESASPPEASTRAEEFRQRIEGGR